MYIIDENITKRKDSIKFYNTALKTNPIDDKLWNDKGTVLFWMGQKEEAIKCYDKALEINPKNDAVLYNKSIVLTSFDRKAEAIQCYNKVIELNPNNEIIWYNMGKSLYDLCQNEKAVQCYDKAIKINSSNAKVWYYKGIVLTSLDKKAEAIQCYNKVIELNPNNKAIWYNMGKSLYDLCQNEKAVQCYDKAIEIDPQFDVAWEGKARVLFELKEFSESIKYYDKAIEINLQFGVAWEGKAGVLFELKEYSESIKCYDKAIKIDPQSDVAWEGKARVLFELKEYSESIECYDKAIKIDPQFDVAWEGKARVLFELKEYSESIKCYDKAIEFDSEYDIAWEGKINALSSLGKFEEAIICYDKVLEINPKNESVFNSKGNVLFNLGKFEKAILCYDWALKINPKNESALNGKINALSSLGKFEEAILCYDWALKINPKNESALNGKINALSSLGKFEEAILCYDWALKINPKNESALNGKINALSSLGKFEEAIICYDKVLEINPKNESALNGKINALSSLGKFEEAIICYDKVLEINPKNESVFNSKGNVLFNLGKFEKAILCYDWALKINPKNESVLNSKGNALSNLGKFEEALECCDKALEINPKNKSALNNKKMLSLKIDNINKDIAITMINEAESEFKKVQDAGFTCSDEKLEAARKHFEAANYDKAKVLVNQFKSQLVRQQQKEIYKKIKESEELLVKTQSLGIPFDSKLLDNANKDYNSEDYLEAISSLKDFKEQFIKNVKQKAKKELTNSESVLVTAKNSRIVIDEDALKEARRLFDSQNYIESIEACNKFKEILNSLIDSNREVAEKEIMKADSTYEKFGALKGKCDDSLLQTAKTCFDKKLYVEAGEKAKSFTCNAEDLLPTLKPSISIEIPDDKFEVNSGKKTTLILKNTGHIAAKAINMEITGHVEKRYESSLSYLDSGSLKNIDVWLKPNIGGVLPLDIIVKYMDELSRDYEEKKEIWIISSSHSNNVPPSIKDENIPRDKSGISPSLATSFPTELSHLYSDPEKRGEGGFGRIFVAKNKKGKDVAVKIPTNWDEATANSFLREMTVWQSLSHENIISMNNLSIWPLPYLELEYANGGSLEAVPKPIDVKIASKIIFDISEGLKYAHGKGIIHCDLKPQNILMVSEVLKYAHKKEIRLQAVKAEDFIKAEDMVPKITDWGLSKLLNAKKSSYKYVYSPLYASPEHIVPETFGKLDFRTDIYQLGIIFYELVTGTLPFGGKHPSEILYKKVISSDVEPPSMINPNCFELDSIILKCLSKEQNSRYQTISEFQQDLARYLNIEYKKSLALSRDHRQFCLLCTKLLELYAKIGNITESIKYAKDLKYYTGDLFSADIDAVIANLIYRADSQLSIDNSLIAEIDLIIHQIVMDSKGER